jgi:hypothetical protein
VFDGDVFDVLFGIPIPPLTQTVALLSAPPPATEPSTGSSGLGGGF